MRILLLAGAAMLAVSGANAGTITVTGSFTATNWQLSSGVPGTPIDPLFLDYSVTFDPAVNYGNSSGQLTIISTNIPYQIRFSHPANFNLFILATSGAPFGCGSPDNSFCAFIQNYQTGVPSNVFQAGVGSVWSAGTITSGIPAVPEPGSWAMFIGGFGVIGAAARRIRKAEAA
jgi:hypothetical protein